MPDGRSQGDSPIVRVTRFVRREGARVAIGVAGGAIVIVGIVLMPLPGPGMLVVLAGLALLATRFEWAQDLLERARERARDVIDRLRSGSDEGQDGPAVSHDGDIRDDAHRRLGSGSFDGRSDVA